MLALFLMLFSASMAQGFNRRTVLVHSTGRDSVFVNGKYVAQAPCKFMLEEGVFEISVAKGLNQKITRRVLIEPGEKVFSLFFRLSLQPEWSSDATEEQKTIIRRILGNMVYIEAQTIPASSLKRYSHILKGDKRVTDSKGAPLKEIQTNPYFVSNSVISVKEWETIMGVKSEMRKIKEVVENIDEVPVLGLSKDDVNAFLAKINHLSGLTLTIPDIIQLDRISPDVRDNVLEQKVNGQWSNYICTDTSKKWFIWGRHYMGPEKNVGIYYCHGMLEFTNEREYCLTDYTYGYGRRHLMTLKSTEGDSHKTCFRLCCELEKFDFDKSLVCSLPDGIINEEQQLRSKYNELFAQSLKSAKNGDANAMRTLGILYHRGLGTESDDQKSKEWIIKAVENGNEAALFQMAYLAKYGVATIQNYAIAKDIYQYLSNKGNMQATVLLGECYLMGWGVVESEKTAIELFKKAADSGSAEGLYYMGKVCMHEPNKDLAKAADYLLASIKKEDVPVDAFYELGNLSMELSKEDKSYKQTAVEYYREGYRRGSALAAMQYALCLHQGDGCRKNDYLSAVILYEYFRNPLGSYKEKAKVAESLGAFYNSGWGLPAERSSCIKWYTIAAEQGNLSAQVKLGQKCKGEDALYWFALAAENGDAEGQYLLGDCYNEGKYTAQDKETALYWMQRSYDSGCANPYFLEKYSKLKKEMGVANTDTLLSILPEPDFKWPGSEEYMTTNWKLVAEKYGRQTPQTAVSMFCNAKHNPVYFTSSIDKGNLNSWADIIKDKVDNESKLFGHMCRFMGYSYISCVDWLLSLSRNIQHDRTIMFGLNNRVASGFINEYKGDIDYCMGKALTSFSLAKKAYLKSCGRQSSEYLKTVIDYAIVALYCNNQKASIDAIEEFADNVRPMLYRELEHLDVEARKQFWNTWQSYFTNVIPGLALFVKDNEKLNALVYDCALLYKGFLLNYEKNAETKGTAENITVSWKDIQKRLGPDEMAMEIIRTTNHQWGLVEYISATIRKKDRAPQITILTLEDPLVNNSLIKSRFYNTTDLYDFVWKKMEPLMGQLKRVYFSPDGAFYNIAIEHVPFDGVSYVDEHWDVYRLSSTRELLNTQKHEKLKSAILIGGLDYGEKTSRSRGGVEALPASMTEVREIDRMMKEAQISSEIASGQLGYEKNFRNVRRYPGIVHFATHGYLWNNDQLRIRKGLKFLTEIKNADAGMLHSGLLLSGANITLQGNSEQGFMDDGILSAAEIAELDFSNTELVVLSACQSGLGDISYDGVFGLQRGFKIAGAQSILMSLWKVDDQATNLFMQAFYKSFLQGKSGNEALSAATKFLREYEAPSSKTSDIVHLYPYRDPKFWAGFILLDGVNVGL